MSSTDIIVTAVSASIALVVVLAMAAFSPLRLQEPNQSASDAGRPAAKLSVQLSMGPDPGGKTGATVTPDSTKTGQPSAGGPVSSTQTGASSTAAPGAASNSTSTRPVPAGEPHK